MYRGIEKMRFGTQTDPDAFSRRGHDDNLMVRSEPAKVESLPDSKTVVHAPLGAGDPLAWQPCRLSLYLC